jgi:FKBP-type peptidyl-prolyl cis-trans isomerase FkpA
MTKVTLREQRREARAARRKRQRIIVGGIIVLVLAVFAFFVIKGINNKPDTSGVITTDSGLQYQDLVVGTGAEAKAGDTVSVHYTGTLEDGTKFDSSLDRNTPFDFTLGAGKVIKGWDEGIAGMKVGGTRKLIIPAALAYGDQGAGSTIPPNATLIFEVQLLDILSQ